jgi:hypothetical protein
MNNVYIKKVYFSLQKQIQREYWEDLGVDARIYEK